MRNIIYKSENLIPWDTQSAFKMTSYRTDNEDHMVFCYMKGYVHCNDLILCSYCFTEHPSGKDSLHLYINCSPERTDKPLRITFGFDGISCADADGEDLTELISYHSFKADDEQGFYWCGEILLDKKLLNRIFSVSLEEKSLVTMNMVQSFENGDMSVLFGNAQDEGYSPLDNMEVFVILNY